MTKLRRSRALPRVAAAVVTVSAIIGGCGSPVAGPAQPTPAATAAAPGSVTGFDPCRDIDDRTVREAGFNPATREPTPATGEYTSACQFTSTDMTLTVSTSNTSFETFRDRYTGMLIGLDIGKRPAVIVQKPQPDLPCELAMQNGYGIVSLQTTLDVAAKQWGMDRCARISDIATVVEQSIDKP